MAYNNNNAWPFLATGQDQWISGGELLDFDFNNIDNNGCDGFDIEFSLLPQNDFQQVQAQPPTPTFNFSLPLSQSYLPFDAFPSPVYQQSMHTQQLTPSICESPITDTPPTLEDHDSSSSTEVRSTRREKKRAGGFPCSSCDKKFDRAGDARKHHLRAHTPQSERQHKCPSCAKRFLWPKDVARHIRNIHRGTNQALVRRDSSIDLKSLLSGKRAPSVSSMNSLLGYFWAAVQTQRLAIRIRARRRSQSSSSKRFVLVTSDEINFRAVDISNVTNSAMLITTVARQLKLLSGSQPSLSTFSLGSGVMQRRPTPDQLFSMLAKLPAGSAPMQLLLEPNVKEEVMDWR